MDEEKCFINSFIDRLTGKAESRCTKFLDVAFRLFLENGYEKVSMSDIVKHSGGSLATLYKHFGSKEQLFIYVLEQKTEELFGDWARQSACYEGKLEAFLMQIGKLLLDVIITDDAILFNRLIVSLGYIDESELKKQTILNLMMRPVNVVSEYLENEKKNGRIEVEDTALCAHQFFNALEEPFMFPRILGVAIDISEERRLKALQQVVSIFCRGLLIKQ